MAKRSVGVFCSDQVNLARMRIPASELLSAEERQLKSVMESGLPTNIQHDMNRLVGWSSTLGHLIDGSMVRVIGMIIEAETDSEKAKLEEVTSQYWDQHHEHGTDALKADLAQRILPAELDNATRHLKIEAFVAIRSRLASELYPEFFDVSSEHVDKDGLVDYQFLLRRVISHMIETMGPRSAQTGAPSSNSIPGFAMQPSLQPVTPPIVIVLGAHFVAAGWAHRHLTINRVLRTAGIDRA